MDNVNDYDNLKKDYFKFQEFKIKLKKKENKKKYIINKKKIINIIKLNVLK